MPVSWFELVSAAFTGGIVVKFLDIFYSDKIDWTPNDRLWVEHEAIITMIK